MIRKTEAWLSKLLGLNIRTFMHDGFWAASPLILEAIMATLLMIVMTNFLTPEVFGAYKFFWAIILMASLTSLPSMNVAMLQSTSNGFEMFGRTIRYKFISSFIGSLGLLLTAAYLHFFKDSSLAVYFVVAAIIFPLLFSFKGAYVYLFGKGSYKKGGLLEFLRIIIKFVPIMVVVIFIHNLGLVIIIDMLLLVLANVIPYLLIVKKIPSGPFDKHMFKYGLNLSIMSITPLIAANLDKIIIAAALTFRANATWAVAFGIGAFLNELKVPLSNVFVPRFTKNAAEAYHWIKDKTFVLLGVGVVIAGIGALITPVFINLLFPASYGTSIKLAQYLFLALSPFILNEAQASWLVSQKTTKSLYKLITFSHGLTIILYAILIPLKGLTGGVISIAASTIFYTIFSRYLMNKEARVCEHYPHITCLL